MGYVVLLHPSENHWIKISRFTSEFLPEAPVPPRSHLLRLAWAFGRWISNFMFDDILYIYIYICDHMCKYINIRYI